MDRFDCAVWWRLQAHVIRRNALDGFVEDSGSIRAPSGRKGYAWTSAKDVPDR
jgi:hypothetical protein